METPSPDRAATEGSKGWALAFKTAREEASCKNLIFRGEEAAKDVLVLRGHGTSK
jgi:hypothetical protein